MLLSQVETALFGFAFLCGLQTQYFIFQLFRLNWKTRDLYIESMGLLVRIYFSILLFFTTTIHASNSEDNRVPSISIAPQKNPETGLLDLNAKFYFNGKPSPIADTFFQSYSLSDFTKLTPIERKAILGTLLAFRNYPQDSKNLDPATTSERQNLVLQNFFDTGYGAFKAEIYEQASYQAFYAEGPNAAKLFQMHRQLAPERAIVNLCGFMGNTHFYNVGAGKNSDTEKASY